MLALLLACLLGLVGVLLYWSYPGKPRPFLDDQGRPLAGSLAEKIFVPINGVSQGMIIKSKDVTHPVLLYLHGGTPDYFLTQQYPTGLDDVFTVVWWEQRGAGLSYSSDTAVDTITLEQRIADTLAVTQYLRERFGQDRIYLMGHSGGTFIGIQAAARAPELYHAYLAVAQMSNQRESEQLAYNYMLQQYKALGEMRMVRKLEAAQITPAGVTSSGYAALRDPAMHQLGIGTMHAMRSIITGLIIPSLQCRDYTLAEKIRLWRAKFKSGISLGWDEVMTTDLRQKVPELAIPVYFFEGIYDYTVSYTLAKDYFVQLHAPVKGFYTFAQSAHSPLFEEPAKMLTIVRQDVLQGTNRLGDIR